MLRVGIVASLRTERGAGIRTGDVRTQLGGTNARGHQLSCREVQALSVVELVDLVALRPIRRRDGTKAVRMADGAFLEVVPVKLVCGERPDGTWMGEGHPSYRWRMGFVIALLRAGYKVISAENHVLAVTNAAELPGGVVPLSERRLLSEALNARISMGGVTVGRRVT
jgi:hypothetical protein